MPPGVKKKLSNLNKTCCSKRWHTLPTPGTGFVSGLKRNFQMETEA